MLIALYSAVPGCGKTTLARQLGNLGWSRLGFADPIRSMVRAFLDMSLSPAQIDDALYLHKEEPITALPGAPTGRHLLRTLGAEWGRAIHADTWVAIMRRRILNMNSRTDRGMANNIVIDDLRYPNELAMVEELGGMAFQILRGGVEANRTAEHGSDNALPIFPPHRRLTNYEGVPEAMARELAAILAAKYGFAALGVVRV